MVSNIKRITVAVLVLAAFAGIIPNQASSAVSPSAQTIFKQSFVNLNNAASYDINGTIGITLPKVMLDSASSDTVTPYLVNGKELRSYFTGSFDKVTKNYQMAMTSYNARTGESPRLEIIGNKEGAINIRVGGFALNTTSSPELSLVQQYLNTWIRVDVPDLPSDIRPLIMPMVGGEGMSYDSAMPSVAPAFDVSTADKKKVEEMNAKIEKAFWTRNVIQARRLAGAKDHTGAPAYRLGLKLNSIGARLFVLDIAKIIGSKPGASDIRELNKVFAKLPVFSGDLIVNKKTMMPELLTLSLSGFEKKAADDVKIAFKISFQHVGSGRALSMPLEYVPIKKIIDQMMNTTTLSTTPLVCALGTACSTTIGSR